MVLLSVLKVKILPVFTLSRAYKDADGFNFGNVDNAVEGVTLLMQLTILGPGRFFRE